MIKVTGTLIVKDYEMVATGDTMSGILFGDSAVHGNHPFPDGTRVNTSRVECVLFLDGAAYVKTRNSLYRIKTLSEILE